MKGVRTLRKTSLVKPRIPEEKLGVVWTPTESKPIIYGEVLVKGPDVPEEYEVGETIIFGPNSGIRIKFNGQRLMIVRHQDVMGRET
jgi:co-chaperonin GroES (HSP10)